MPAVRAALAARWQPAAAVWIERLEVALEFGLEFALSGLTWPARAAASLRPAPSQPAWPSASARRQPARDQVAVEREGRCANRPTWRSDRAGSRWSCRRRRTERRALAPALIRLMQSKRTRQTS